MALARAVLGRPRVLVLDDPLSALDVHTESLVEQALRRVLDSTTALLVVHRPSTVALADRVALLERGSITAVGTHSELMASTPGLPRGAVPARRGGAGVSAPPSAPASPPSIDSWRGVAAEHQDDLPSSTRVRLQRRSRRLLGSLLRPHRRSLWWVLVLLLLQNAAAMAGPYLVKVGIDRGIPPLDDGEPPTVLVAVTVAFVVAAVVEYLTKRAFLVASGRIGQAVLLRPAHPCVRPLPAAVAGLPRALYVWSGDLPADQ